MTAIEHHTDCDSLDGSRNYHVGDCHQLAAVISRATGWDFAIFDGAGAHVTVITPDGQYLDITGPRTAEDIRAQWHADKPQITDSIWAEGWDTNPCVCDWRTARDVLDHAGLLTDDISEAIAWEIDKLTD